MKNYAIMTVKQYGNILRLFRSSAEIQSYPRGKSLLDGMEELQATLGPLYSDLQKQDTYYNDQVAAAIEKVCTIGYPLGKAVEDISLQKGDTVLARNIHTGYVLMTRKGGDNLYDYGQEIVKGAETVVDELADYNKGKASIDELKAALLVLKKANDDRAANAIEQQSRNMQFEILVKQMKATVESCGIFMETIRMDQPEAYRLFQKELKMPEANTVQSSIRIFDEATKEPLLEAKVEVFSTTRKENGQPLKVLVRKTGVSGELRIAKLEQDIYEVVVTKLSHEPATAKMIVADSRMVRVEVYLKPVALN